MKKTQTTCTTICGFDASKFIAIENQIYLACAAIKSVSAYSRVDELRTKTEKCLDYDEEKF